MVVGVKEWFDEGLEGREQGEGVSRVRAPLTYWTLARRHWVRQRATLGRLHHLGLPDGLGIFFSIHHVAMVTFIGQHSTRAHKFKTDLRSHVFRFRSDTCENSLG